jgi:CDP-diacylglycerol--glycerol-3-phosphate 3-phosphatidyltransferase
MNKKKERVVLRQLPNLISAARIASVPVLGWLAWQGRVEPFQWLLLAALLSDILDGLIARGFNLGSPLGAFLDSVADALLMVVAVYGVWVFHRDFVTTHGAWVLLVLGLWLLEMLISLLRYGRISSFHTYAVRAGAYALGVFVMALFLWGFNPWLFGAAVVINVLAYLEELAILWLLPAWTANVRGLYWLLRDRERAS